MYRNPTGCLPCAGLSAAPTASQERTADLIGIGVAVGVLGLFAYLVMR